MVMSMMFMNMAATNTTLTLTLGLICMRGKAFVPGRWWWRRDVRAGQRCTRANTDRRPGIPEEGRIAASRAPRGPSAVEEAQPDLAPGIVAVGVDQDDALPGAQERTALEDRDAQRRAHEHREDMVGPMAGCPVAMGIAIVTREQTA